MNAIMITTVPTNDRKNEFMHNFDSRNDNNNTNNNNTNNNNNDYDYDYCRIVGRVNLWRRLEQATTPRQGRIVELFVTLKNRVRFGCAVLRNRVRAGCAVLSNRINLGIVWMVWRGM